MTKDQGSTSAIAFILIVAGVIAVAAVWLVVVYPIQIHETDEKEIQTAIAKLTDTRLMMEAAAGSSYMGVEIVSPLPKGSLEAGSGGTLYFNDEAIPVGHLGFSVGDTSVGIAANGIWRQDTGGASWVMFPQYQRNRTCISFDVITFENTLAVASTEMIPFRFAYMDSKTHTFTGRKAVLLFTSDDAGLNQVWQTQFREVALLLQQITDVTQNKINGEAAGNMLTLSSKAGEISVQVTEHRYRVYAGDFV